MGTPEDIESRLSAVERGVAQLRAQQGLTASDAAAARVLAAGADHDVSEVRAELRAHTSALNALRETQLEQGRRLDRMDGRFDRIDGRLDGIDGRFDRIDGRLDGVDGRLDRIDGRFDGMDGQLGALESRMADGFATVGAGMAQIVTLLEGLDDRDR